MNTLEEYRKQYKDSEGIELLIGGLDSYIYPEKMEALAVKYKFKRHKSFDIDDMEVLDEVRHYLENNRMVAVAAYTVEKRIDLFLE
jgi:hypothetical protein